MISYQHKLSVNKLIYSNLLTIPDFYITTMTFLRNFNRKNHNLTYIKVFFHILTTIHSHNIRKHQFVSNAFLLRQIKLYIGTTVIYKQRRLHMFCFQRQEATMAQVILSKVFAPSRRPQQIFRTYSFMI